MARKVFCDICGDEITELGRNRLTFTADLEGTGTKSRKGFVVVEFHHSDKKNDLREDVCRNCMWTALERSNPLPNEL